VAIISGLVAIKKKYDPNNFFRESEHSADRVDYSRTFVSLGKTQDVTPPFLVCKYYLSDKILAPVVC